MKVLRLEVRNNYGSIPYLFDFETITDQSRIYSISKQLRINPVFIRFENPVFIRFRLEVRNNYGQSRIYSIVSRVLSIFFHQVVPAYNRGWFRFTFLSLSTGQSRLGLPYVRNFPDIPVILVLKFVSGNNPQKCPNIRNFDNK